MQKKKIPYYPLKTPHPRTPLFSAVISHHYLKCDCASIDQKQSISHAPLQANECVFLNWSREKSIVCCTGEKLISLRVILLPSLRSNSKYYSRQKLLTFLPCSMFIIPSALHRGNYMDIYGQTIRRYTFSTNRNFSFLQSTIWKNITWM